MKLTNILVAAMIGFIPVVVAPPAQADSIHACWVWGHGPTDITSALRGSGEINCDLAVAPMHRVRVKLQERKVRFLWPDEWVTKKVSRWSPWTTRANSSKYTYIECDSQAIKKWRVVGEGQAIIASDGSIRSATGTTRGKYRSCHVENSIIF